jgi:hypothetical protein
VLHTSVVSLGLTSAPIGGALPVSQLLRMTVQHQLQTQWCWAAVTTSVATYFRNRQWTQCRMVNDRLGQRVCCTDGASTVCNRPWYLDRALERVGNLEDFTSGPLSLADVRADIDEGRPICVRIGWSGGGGHFVAIAGYSEAGVLDIQDPWFGRSAVGYLAFRTRYRGTGRWTHTYRTKPRGPQLGAATGFPTFWRL